MKFSKLFLLSLALLFCSVSSYAQDQPEKYSQVRVWFSPEFTLQEAENLGLEIEHSVLKPNVYIEVTASETSLRLLKEKSVQTEIIIDDLSKFYRNRTLQGQKFLKDFKTDRTLGGKNVPQNFKLGSLGGFYTLEEIKTEFEEMRTKFPDLVSLPEKIGSSIEGRDIFAYRISTPIFTNAKYEVLYTALHHAREPGGVTTLTYFLWDILERYKNGDSEAKYLLENRELYIIPVINTDGYAYNQQTAPDGGGMWRKNRRKVDNDSYGIDLNRNYGPIESWDAPVDGSSTNPDFDNYRGPAPFSEPETQAIRNFCRSHVFKNALNYHTYGGLLIYPFATKQTETPDSAMYRGMAAEFIKVNKYAAGTGLQTVGYNVRGDSDEWMYLTETQKQKIFAMTPEVGTVIDGFWPFPARIIPLAQENLFMNYQHAWSAGINIRPQHIFSNTATITVRCNNIGLLPSGDSVEISAVSLNPLVTIGNAFKKLSPLPNKAEDEVMFPYQVSGTFKNGDRAKVLITILQQGVARIDTFEMQLFKSTVNPLFAGNDNGNWEKNSWEIFTDHFGITAFTDSPNDNYQDSEENYLQYLPEINLTGINHATLRFKTRWSIESKADFAVVQVAENNSVNWKTLQTSRMRTGLGLPGSKQKKDEYGFDGNFPEWTEQEASLDAFIGKKVRLRFGVLSDEGSTFDGWYLAEIDLVTYENVNTGITEDHLLNESLQIYPNPAFKNDKISISNPFKNDFAVEARIADNTGKIVFKSNNFFKNNTWEFSLQNLAPGTYHIVLQQNGKEIVNSFIIR
jgi:hypothetical protein